MDYTAFCKNFFSATNIPVSLLKSGNPVYSALGEVLGLSVTTHWTMFPYRKNPEFCAISPDLEFGRVFIEGTEYDLIVGPAFSVPVTDQLVRQFMKEVAVPLNFRELLTEILCSMPQISHLQFARYLAFLHQCLNGKVVEPNEIFLENEADSHARKVRQVNNMADNQEKENLHNSYSFEQELYQYIKDGNTDKLKIFLSSVQLSGMKEGNMARSPLRNAKNLFIGTVTKVGMLAAIPGGVDIEQTYQLIDDYSRECEQLQSIDDIMHLEYIMMLDFCQRCGESQIPEGVSADVYRCMNYIRSHTNEPISIEDAAAHVNRSTSYMMKHFKSELGIHMGAYIMRCKLEEAKSLLTYSEKSLAEISSYLCFSSQSYFQNVFKKQYGMTPLQYRRSGSVRK